MFLHYLNDNSMVCDFQLIYDTDSKPHLDFYAYGLANESKMLSVNAVGEIISYGMYKVDMNGYIQIMDKIDLICNDHAFLYDKIIEMKKSIDYLKNINNLVEALIMSDACNINEMRNCFEAMVNTMSYRRLADKAGEMLSENIDVERIAKLGPPSYLLILQESKERIRSNEDISVFIKEYGYLNSFNIAPTAYESYEYLKESIDKEEKSGQLLSLNVDYDDSKCENNIEKMLYGLMWFSELRHIYQLRTLRNFRWFFEKTNMNIFNTGAKELFHL